MGLIYKIKSMRLDTTLKCKFHVPPRSARCLEIGEAKKFVKIWISPQDLQRVVEHDLSDPSSRIKCEVFVIVGLGIGVSPTET